MLMFESLCKSMGPGLLLLVTSSCETIRNNEVIRATYYPPVVENAKALGPNTPGMQMDHVAYASVLQQFVDEQGLVDYGGMMESPKRLQYYAFELGNIELGEFGRHEQLAILLNAYNVFTLQLLLEHPKVSSIMRIPDSKRWKARRWRVGGIDVSLKELEHEIIRREYMDPRIHFALVRASKGSAKLRSEPYTGIDLDRQLDEQARYFFSQPSNFQWNPLKGVVKVSESFDWYRSDYGKDEKQVLRALMPYLIPGQAEEIKERFDEIRIQYLNFDWSLNGK
jgi:hypothetical protein